MKIAALDDLLQKLQALISEDRFEELETDTLELKPVPPDAGSWRERHKTVCSFLNTRGGMLLLGIRERGTGSARRYEVSGWQSQAEPNLKEFPNLFTDRQGQKLALADSFPPPIIREFQDKQIAIVLIDELPADRKYVFYRGEAFKRILTGDHKIAEGEIERQEEFKRESLQARELQPIEGVVVSDLSLDKLNEYITQLNRPVRVETIKPDMSAALPFLERKAFVKNGKVTTLGLLVCGEHPADHLGFRCHVHCYVDAPSEIARDKQDLVNNVLPLMEDSLAFILRSIQIGVTIERGGRSRPQYPEELLRETVNNALAHRDYSINRQVIIAIKPGRQISIRNPGVFQKQLLISSDDDGVTLRRILPEAKPRNPRLADVLRVFRKWEGRGIGMATLVDLCLKNRIDVPYYQFATEEVTLVLRAGQLLDERIESLLHSYDRYLEEKLSGLSLSESQKLVLAYLIKSEWANEQFAHTILLSPDNNHFRELSGLEAAGLISRHSASTDMYPVYVVDRTLMQKDHVRELRAHFGPAFDTLNAQDKDVLGVIFRFNNFSKTRAVSAKQASFDLWHRTGLPEDILKFDVFYRKVRRSFARLRKDKWIEKLTKSHGHQLSDGSLQREALV